MKASDRKKIHEILKSKNARSRKVHSIRMTLHMSQKEFAEKIAGSDQSHISKWEKGGEISDLSWKKIEDAFGL